jgi:hypothetical protein
MSERDETTQRERESFLDTTRTGDDDRRGQRNPADGPAPRSPEPEEEALRSGEEKLERVKAY